MRDMSYFTKTDPINYDYVAQDNMKHLYFRDYKYLADVKFVDDNLTWYDIIGLCGLVIAVLSIIVILFLGV